MPQIQHIDLSTKSYEKEGRKTYEEVIFRAKKVIPKRKNRVIAQKIGLAESAFSACLREKDPTVMRSVPFCALVVLLGGEIFYPDEDKPQIKEADCTSLEKENEFLREQIAELKQIIKEKTNTISLLLEGMKMYSNKD